MSSSFPRPRRSAKWRTVLSRNKEANKFCLKRKKVVKKRTRLCILFDDMKLPGRAPRNLGDCFVLDKIQNGFVEHSSIPNGNHIIYSTGQLIIVERVNTNTVNSFSAGNSDRFIGDVYWND